MKVSKIKFIIILILLILLILIPPVMIIKEVVYWKALANDTEKKLNQINITELEDKLIAELEKSSINVDNSLFTTEFAVCRDDTYDEAALYLELYYGLNELNNPYDGWILACIKENKEESKRLYIPLYKIEGKSKEGSNVFNIKYAQPIEQIWENEYEVYNILEKVLKQYKINLEKHSLYNIASNREKYEEFPIRSNNYRYSNGPDIIYTDYEFYNEVMFKLYNEYGNYNLNKYEAKDLAEKFNLRYESWK